MPPRGIVRGPAILAMALVLGGGAPSANAQPPKPAAGAGQGGVARSADPGVWSRALAALEAALSASALERAEEHAFTALREAAHFAPGDPRLRKTQEALSALSAQERRRSPAAFDRFARASLALLESEAGPRHPLTLHQLAEIGMSQRDRDEHAAAVATFEEIRRRTDGSGANATIWLGATIALAEIENRTGKPEEAGSLAAKAREVAEKAFGPENAYAFIALTVESRAARALGRREDAAQDLRRALEIAAKVAPRDPRASVARLDYGTLLLELCRHDDARREIRAAADALVASLGKADPRAVDALATLATAEAQQGEWSAARPAAERALAAAEELALRAGAGAEIPLRKLIETRAQLAEIELALDRGAEAKALLERTRSLAGVRARPADDADLASRLALAEASLGHAPEAARLAGEALGAADSGLLSPLAAADVRVRAALVFVRTGDFARAEGIASRAIPTIERSTAPEERLLRALRALAQAQAGAGKRETALETLWRARSVGSACFGATSPLLEPVAREEAAILAELGRSREGSVARSRAEALAERVERPDEPEPRAGLLEDPELNFALRPPPAPWASLPRGSGPVAPRYAFGRARPRMRFEVFARDTGAPVDLRDEEALARALEGFGATQEGVETRWIGRKERTIHGIAGVQMVSQLSATGRTWYDVSWLGSHAGIVYKLSVSAQKSTPEALAAEAQALFEGLAILDPTRGSTRGRSSDLSHSPLRGVPGSRAPRSADRRGSA